MQEHAAEPADWIQRLNHFYRGPSLGPDAIRMQRVTPAAAPFTDATPIVVRNVYEQLYMKFRKQQQGGTKGAILLGSPGVGVATFGDYIAKR